MRKNDIRGGTREWSKNLWEHIKALFSGLDTRVTALEQGGGGGGGAVSGVKGDAESSYRTGNVNLTPANIGAKATQSAVSDPTASGTGLTFIDSITQDAQGVITPTKKTVQTATQSADGVMSSTDKTKLDGIAAGAEVNTITGVKGDAENSYRTGKVNLTLANVGAPQTAHYNPTNLDTLKSTGLYSAWSVSGTGTSDFDSLFGEVINISENPWGTGSRVNQIFLSFFSNEIWQRKLTDNTWSSWKQLTNKNGAVPISAGGTGQTDISYTTTISSIASAASGFSISSASYTQWGKVGMVALNVKRTGAALTNSTQTVCDMVSGKRPKDTSAAGSSNSNITNTWINPGGAVRVHFSSIANSAEFSVCSTYILA